MNRGKWSLAVDLKHPEGVATLLRLVDGADAFFEVFRPGVAERLGFGPDVCLARNPRLIYGRLTGWGQEGPLRAAAGHDIDYLALAGALEPLGRAGQPPTPPINVLGDFAGGGMLLAFGIACAAFERAASGKGQVVDAAMVDGAALMLTPFYAARAPPASGDRAARTSSTPVRRSTTRTRRPTAGGSRSGPSSPSSTPSCAAGWAWPTTRCSTRSGTRSSWPAQKERLAAVFRTKTRDEWCELLEHTDACFAPALAPTEAPDHPHNRARQTFLRINDVPQPAPAPRFSRTPATVTRPPTHAGEDDDEALGAWGFTPADIHELRAAGAIA